MTLQEAVEKTAGGPVKDSGWVAVKETFRGQLIWEGAVSLFEIYDQPGSFIYAWSVKNKAGDGAEHVTVKGEGKIDSPIAAVRAWMVSQAKQ